MPNPNSQLKVSRPILWVFGIFVGIFLYGFSENLRGSILPSILNDLNLSYGLGGMILAANPLGFICTPWLAGRLLPKWGFQKLYLISSSLLFLGFGLFALSEQIHYLILGQFMAGLGLGALQLLTNSTLIFLWPKHKARLLSFGAIAFSLGATFSPIFVNHFARENSDWPNAFYFVVVLSIFFGFPFLKRVKLPIPTDCAQEKKEPTRLFHLKGFKRFSLIFGCYALIEIGFSAWLVEFLKSFYNQSANEARYLLSLYFIALLCGRIIGSLYLDQLGYKISALIHLVLFLTFGSVLIFYSSHWSIVLTIGLSASVFFPIMTALASDQFLEKTQEALGFFYSIAGIGGIIALWGIGKFGEIFNLQLALVLILIAAFIMIICIGTLKSEPK